MKTEIISPVLSVSDIGVTKKKKYKIVPNDSNVVTPHKSNEMCDNELPKDRKDLLNFVSYFKINIDDKFFVMKKATQLLGPAIETLETKTVPDRDAL